MVRFRLALAPNIVQRRREEAESMLCRRRGKLKKLQIWEDNNIKELNGWYRRGREGERHREVSKEEIEKRGEHVTRRGKLLQWEERITN
jgi:hypothetical protein